MKNSDDRERAKYNDLARDYLGQWIDGREEKIEELTLENEKLREGLRVLSLHRSGRPSTAHIIRELLGEAEDELEELIDSIRIPKTNLDALSYAKDKYRDETKEEFRTLVNQDTTTLKAKDEE